MSRTPLPGSFHVAGRCLSGVRPSELHRDCTVFTLAPDFHIYRRLGNKVIPVLMPGK